MNQLLKTSLSSFCAPLRKPPRVSSTHAHCFQRTSQFLGPFLSARARARISLLWACLPSWPHASQTFTWRALSLENTECATSGHCCTETSSVTSFLPSPPLPCLPFPSLPSPSLLPPSLPSSFFLSFCCLPIAPHLTVSNCFLHELLCLKSSAS